MRSISKVMGFLSVIGAFGVLSCIERDNPFDPVNLSRVQPDLVRTQQDIFFDSLEERSQAILALLLQIKARGTADSNRLGALEAGNEVVLLSNQSLRNQNQVTQGQNDQETDPAKLQFQRNLDSLAVSIRTTSYNGLGRYRNELNLMRSMALVRMDSINSAYFPFQIYPDSLRRKIPAPMDSVLKVEAALAADSTAWDSRIQKHIQSTQQENLRIVSENLVIDQYNIEIEFRRTRGSRPLISTSEGLESAISNMSVGDSLYLDSGIYSGRIPNLISGTQDQPILIQGRPGGRTILSSGSGSDLVSLDKKRNIIFKDLVFANSGVSGARVTNFSDSIVFERCEFRNNSEDGLHVANAGVRVENCVFIGNRGDGIHLQSPTESGFQVSLFNVLVVHNGGHGIVGIDLKGTLNRATIADNGQDGIHFSGVIGDLSIYASIIVFQKGYGFNFTGTTPPGDQLVVSNCDIYGNALDNFSQPLPASTLNTPVSIDPRFVSRDSTAGLDYSLRPDSELLLSEAWGTVFGWRKP